MKLLGYKRIWEVSITICTCLLLFQTSFFQWLAEVDLDLLFKTRGEIITSQSIVIIGIDEPSLQKYGPWPFPRSTHALLLEQLQDAKVIGFDLLFSHSDSEDKIFADAIDNAPPVVMAVASNYQDFLIKPSSKFTNRVLLGHIETSLGTDGIVRRVQLQKFAIPVFAAAMVQAAGDYDLRTVSDGNSGRLLNFYGSEFTFLYLSYADVLEGKYAAGFFKDRYVLVGAMALALGDVHITPFSKRYPLPGVEVQATILNNILENSFLKELDWLVRGLCGLCFLMLIWLWPHKSEAQNAIICSGFALSITLLSSVLFHFNYFLNTAVPLFVLFICYLSHSIFRWIKITTGMIKEIKSLDRQLLAGIETVFLTLPSSLAYMPPKENQHKLSEGLQKHITHMHRGIQALALQNGFINHLISEATPPLILWQQENGMIVLANNRFSTLWTTTLNPGKELPTLEEFQKFISDKKVSNTKAPVAEDSWQAELGTVDRIVDISTTCAGRKAHHRAVIHNVADTELGFIGILASFTDVTEIRELERLKGEVMNIVSHELKLPLTTIIGFAEMLTEYLEGPEKEYAVQIQSQSNRLAKMIEDFLDIARIESGKYLIHKYPFDLLTVVHDAASVVAHSATVKNIQIIYELPHKLSPLLGDESLLVQAILNLLDNAVKFSNPSTMVKLSVVELKETIQLQVEDGGAGIIDTEKPLVFEKFIRGANQSNESGFGLGLSFVKEVVEGHSGFIRVGDSRLGGAMFTITLPKVL